MSTDTPAAAPVTTEREAPYTVVFRGLTANERQALNAHPKAEVMSYSHAIHDRDEARAALSAPVAAPPQDMNQCDGCKQGAELRNGLHYDRHGKVFMACQRDKYESPVAAQPAVSGVDALWAESLPTLYDRTGDIKDINTLLVNRAALRTHLSTALTGAAKETK